MNTTPRRQPNTPDLASVSGAPRDFVAVDDSGDFSYHRSGQDLMTAFEYVGEAACIIDRSGSAYRLVLDRNHHLVLGPTFGPVEFHWLRQAWREARNAHPEEHRLRRFVPVTREEVVSDLFETLMLEHGPAPAVGPWSLERNGITSHPASLDEIDSALARQDLVKDVWVKDPFGHRYRPLRRRRHWCLPARAGHILYIEVPVPAASP